MSAEFMRHALAVALATGLLALWGFLRFLRWQWLLRQFDLRVPIRGGLIRYAVALPGWFTPFGIGEALLRGWLGARSPGPGWSGVLPAWVLERVLDAGALTLLIALVTGSWSTVAAVLTGGAVLWIMLWILLRRSPADRFSLAAERFRTPIPIAVALAISLLAWLPALGALGVTALVIGVPVPLGPGVGTASAGFLNGLLALNPVAQLGGPGVVTRLFAAAWILAMLGGAIVAGVLLIRSHRGRHAVDAAAHFDEIAGEYLAQFAGHVWDLLLRRRVGHLARAAAGCAAVSPLGLDLGCGLGRQRQAMREAGFRVIGVDPARALLRQGKVGDGGAAAGSALALPFRTGAFDFVYTVGVLHHVGDPRAQKVAVAEIRRVLRPGGRLIVQESNPRNPLFRFYMGYLFPLLRAIDDGTEWWIAPRRWHTTEGLTMSDLTYFTFLPDFLPRALLPPLLRIEAWMERSVLRGWSVHYQAVLTRQPAVPGGNGDPC